MKFFEELKRRNVFKETLAYLVASWVLLQVASIILPIVDAPEWVLKTLTFFLALGLPVWIFFSWAYQVTPDGFKKTKISIEGKSPEIQSNKRLNYLILLGLAIAVVVTVFKRSESPILSLNMKEVEKSIAVLPFDDFSQGGDAEWFCDGVTADIRTNLSKIKGITKVISHTSVEKFKNSEKTIPEIANELGVSFILEGNVRKHEDRIIITAKLIDGNDNQIWAENYNDNFDKVFDIQSSVAKQITEKLQITISPEESNSINSSKTKNFEAYELYLRGRHLLNQQVPESVNRSVEYLQESIQMDPEFAPAYVSLAECFIFLNRSIKNNEEKLLDRQKSEKAIQKALDLDENLGEAYLTKGHMIGIYSWEWDEMKYMIEKGLKIEPNNSYGHMLLSKYYLIKNEYDRALEEALLAEKLDPLNPRIGSFVAKNYFFSGDNEKSLDQYQKVIETFPNYADAWEGAGRVLLQSGNKKAALRSWRKFHDMIGNDDLVEVYSKETFDNSINFWLQNAPKGDAIYCSLPTTISYVYMITDDKQQALDYLEIAYTYRDQDLPLSVIAPHFYPLYDNERFQKIVKGTGVFLPDTKLEFEILE